MIRRIAIIGSGAAGIAAAHRLHSECEITLFEREQRLGGHAWTFHVLDGPDKGLPLDLAFVVMNTSRYPTMTRLLGQLDGVRLAHSEMSFSYCDRRGQSNPGGFDDTEYVINRESPVLPAPQVQRLLVHALHFGRTAVRDLARGDIGEQTLGDYLAIRNIDPMLRDHYVLPMGAALWSVAPEQILSYPAETFLRYLDNHGLLAMNEGLQWYHVEGGSSRYVDAVLRHIAGAMVRVGEPVLRLEPDADGVVVHTGASGAQRFDYAIVATHADEAFALLHQPGPGGVADPFEAGCLRSIRYQANDGVLHWDESVMPRQRACWAALNYEREAGEAADRVCISYFLNRLQGHTNAVRPYLLSLNRRQAIDPEKVMLRIRFDHPMFDANALRAQKALRERGVVGRVALAGSYFGYGFHEDAMASGVAAAQALLARTAQEG
jgi:predicted NAD/FAD-binding protein